MLHEITEAQTDRRTRILDAAERRFARNGFHRTTMQDVAADAGMSPGNLYRYFVSKDALIEGLAERDRADVARDFMLLAEAEDFIAAFKRIGRRHFAEEPRERSILCLEIWAEATRNAAFGAMAQDFERDVVERMTSLFRSAQERGLIPSRVDAGGVAVLVATLADGLFVRRAILPGFDAEREVGNALAVIEALLDGSVHLPSEAAP